MADTKLGPSKVAKAYDGPPDFRQVERHEVFPETTHDEIARFNFLAHMNKYLSTNLLPGAQEAFQAHVEPEFKKKHGRDFKDRHEIQKALTSEPAWQWWSALRRATMESRQQAGRWVTIRQADALNAKVKEATLNDSRLKLDPKLKLPRGVEAIDHHCMPGRSLWGRV